MAVSSPSIMAARAAVVESKAPHLISASSTFLLERRMSHPFAEIKDIFEGAGLPRLKDSLYGADANPFDRSQAKTHGTAHDGEAQS